MSANYKVLGQSAPSATTEADLYTVPAATQTILSTVSIVNRGTSSASFRLSVSVAGAATTNKDYLAYDVIVPANSFLDRTIGLTLNATDKVKVYASSANLSFAAFGCEI